MTFSSNKSLTRREALAALGGGLVALSGCDLGGVTESTPAGPGRLTARPGTPGTLPPPTGVSALPLTLGLVGLVFVPTTYKPSTPAPLALLLHGAGHASDELMTPIAKVAEERGLVLVAIDSKDFTWDMIEGFFGPDVKAMDAALSWVFARCAIDPARVGVIGFSDGATYSLTIGRLNGDLFRRVVAYSPGFIVPIEAVGRPEFFITHGTRDGVLSVEGTRNSIVPQLKEAGYLVQYREFDGGHGVTDALLTESIDWFVRKT